MELKIVEAGVQKEDETPVAGNDNGEWWDNIEILSMKYSGELPLLPMGEFQASSLQDPEDNLEEVVTT